MKLFLFNEQIDMLLVYEKSRQKFSESGSTIHWMLSGSYPSLALYILTDTWKIKRYWDLKYATQWRKKKVCKKVCQRNEIGD